MSSSERIAGLVGPTLIALNVSEAINLDIWKTNSPPVTYLNGTLLFVGGLAVVRAHNRWLRAWPVVITLVGWFAIALGLFRMFAPKAQRGGENLPTFVVICAILAVGIFLTIKAYVPSGDLRDRLRRWMYRGGHPNPIARFVNGIWKLAGLTGLSGGRLEHARGARPAHRPSDLVPSNGRRPRRRALPGLDARRARELGGQRARGFWPRRAPTRRARAGATRRGSR